MLTIFGATQVELVGQNVLVSVLAPVCVLAAALVGALLAGKLANNRLAQELQNANSRLVIELENDRHLRRDEHRRDALDSTLRLANELHIGVENAISRTEEVRQEWLRLDSVANRSTLEGRVKALSTVLQKAVGVFDRIPELRAAAGPMKVRFGVEHEVPKAVEALAEAWSDNGNDLRLAWIKEGNFDAIEDWRSRFKVSRHNFNHLLATSERWLRETDTVAMARIDSDSVRTAAAR